MSIITEVFGINDITSDVFGIDDTIPTIMNALKKEGERWRELSEDALESLEDPARVAQSKYFSAYKEYCYDLNDGFLKFLWTLSPEVVKQLYIRIVRKERLKPVIIGSNPENLGYPLKAGFDTVEFTGRNFESEKLKVFLVEDTVEIEDCRSMSIVEKETDVSHHLVVRDNNHMYLSGSALHLSVGSRLLRFKYHEETIMEYAINIEETLIYEVEVHSRYINRGGVNSIASIILKGQNRESGVMKMNDYYDTGFFEIAGFNIKDFKDVNVGILKSIVVTLDSMEGKSKWAAEKIVIRVKGGVDKWVFTVNSWFDDENTIIERHLYEK